MYFCLYLKISIYKGVDDLRFLHITGLCLLLFLAMTLPTSAQFKDVPTSNPYHTMIEQLEKDNIITGYSDGTFKPNATVTRAHVAAIINRAVTLAPIRPATTFADVPTTYPYYDDIQALYRAGIIDGHDGYFNPRAPLTRGQLSKILTNVFELHEQVTSAFDDVPINHPYNTSVGALVATNATTGYADGTFRPTAHVTRQHFAVFFYRLQFDDTLPLSNIQPKKLVDYLNKLTKVQTNKAMFYGSPAVPYAYVKSYATAFTNEEAAQLTKFLNVSLTAKPRFLVLDYDKDLARYGGEILEDPNVLGWINSLENVVVLTTNMQPVPLQKPDLALLNHEYFHWILTNEMNVHIDTLWVEEALADNFGALFAENKTRFIDTTLFKNAIAHIKSEGFVNPTEPYSEESIAAIALLEQQYGQQAIVDYLHYARKMSDSDAFYKVFNIRYSGMFNLVKDYINAGK